MQDHPLVGHPLKSWIALASWNHMKSCGSDGADWGSHGFSLLDWFPAARTAGRNTAAARSRMPHWLFLLQATSPHGASAWAL